MFCYFVFPTLEVGAKEWLVNAVMAMYEDEGV